MVSFNHQSTSTGGESLGENYTQSPASNVQSPVASWQYAANSWHRPLPTPSHQMMAPISHSMVPASAQTPRIKLQEAVPSDAKILDVDESPYVVKKQEPEE